MAPKEKKSRGALPRISQPPSEENPERVPANHTVTPNTLSPINKRERTVRRYGNCCQQIVQCLWKNLNEEKQNKAYCYNYGRALDRLIKYTGINQQTVCELKNENIKFPDLNADREERDRQKQYSEEDVWLIRPTIAEMIIKDVPLTLNNLLKCLKDQEEGFNWQRTTLWRILTEELGFEFRHRRGIYYDWIREKRSNVEHRNNYIRWFLKYEKENRPFIFTDETFLHQNHITAKGWRDPALLDETQEKYKTGKGKRWCVNGAGTKDGWLDSCWDIW